MAPKTLFLCAATLLVQSALAVPAAFPKIKVPAPILRRANYTVDPSHNVTPTITEIGELTEQELQDLINEIEEGASDLFSKRAAADGTEPALRPRATGTDGALLTFTEDTTDTPSGCEAFELNGPFSMIHALMGSSNLRGFSATSFTGNTTDVQAGETINDPKEFKFANNERITKFSIATVDPDPVVAGFTFETDGGNKYEALSQNIVDNKATPVYTDLPIGAGIIARVRGSKCSNGILSGFGIDFLDELDSIKISNIDYSGFTDNIMPAGSATQLSVGSQILDNRNSSEKQTITLTTTDAVTAQRTITTQIRAMVGGSVSIEASVGVPLISEGKTTATADWQIEALNVSPSCYPPRLLPQREVMLFEIYILTKSIV